MTLLAVGVSMVLAVLALSGHARAIRRIKALEERPETAPTAPYDDGEIRAAIEVLSEYFEALDSKVADLHLAVDEGIKHVDRSERRVRAVVQRARKRLEDLGYEDEGLDAEAEGLSIRDAPEGNGQGVPPVPSPMGQSGDRFAAFPGSWDGYGEVG